MSRCHKIGPEKGVTRCRT